MSLKNLIALPYALLFLVNLAWADDRPKKIDLKVEFKKIEKLYEKVNKLVQRNSTPIKAINTVLARKQTTLTRMRERVKKIEGQYGERASSKLGKLPTAIKKLNDEIAALNGKRSEIEAKNTELQQKKSDAITRFSKTLYQLVETSNSPQAAVDEYFSMLIHSYNIPIDYETKVIHKAMLEGLQSFASEQHMSLIGDKVFGLKEKKLFLLKKEIFIYLAAITDPSVIYALVKTAKEGKGIFQLLAIEKAGFVKSKHSVDLLVEVYIGLVENDELKARPELVEKISLAFHNLGIDNPIASSTAQNLREVWEKKRPAVDLHKVEEEEDDEDEINSISFIRGGQQKELIGLEKAPPAVFMVVTGDWVQKNENVKLKDGKSKKMDISHDGNNDRIEEVFNHFGDADLASKMVKKTRNQFRDLKLKDLRDTALILVNCANFEPLCLHPEHPHSGGIGAQRARKCEGKTPHINSKLRFSKKDRDLLYEFVMKGGWVLAEDWAIHEIIDKTPFTKYISAKVKAGPKEISVGVMPHHPADPLARRLLRGVMVPENTDIDDNDDEHLFDINGGPVKRGTTVVKLPPKPQDNEATLNPQHDYILDAYLYWLEIENKQRVHVLLKSDKVSNLVKAATGKKNLGPVALVFQPKPRNKKENPGRFVAFLGHFGKNGAQAELGLKNFFANVLIEAEKQRRTRSKWAEKK